MGRALPCHRIKPTVRMQQAKALLLPLQRPIADGLSLRYHIALEAMRTTNGYPAAVNTLTAVMLLTQFLAAAGYGRISGDVQAGCERAISAAFEAGNEKGEWKFNDVGYASFATILNVHDFQLYTAPLSAIIAAGEQLDRLQADEPSRNREQKRA
jgi:hypothetical protein